MKTTTVIIAVIILLIGISGCISPELRTAKIAINEKDWRRALDAIEEEIARVPDNAEAYFYKGYCQEKLGDYVGMSESYMKSLELSTVFADEIDASRDPLVARFVARAINKGDSGEIETALANIDTALIIKKDLMIYQQAAVMAYNNKLYDVAKEYSSAGMKLPDGSNDETLVKVMLACARDQGDHDETIVCAIQLMEIVDPMSDESEAYLSAFDDLIAAYSALGNHEAAKEATEAAIGKFPDRVDLRKNLAILFIKKKDYDGAMTIYTSVLEKEPEDLDANLSVGTILSNQEKFVEAIPYLEKAYRIEPDNKIAVQNLMAAYYNTDQYEKGKELKEVFDKLSAEE